MKSLYESIISKAGVGKIYLIQKWLDEHGIKNYTINSKEEINVDGDVILDYKNLTVFPSYIQFGTVKGHFNCSNNNLVSLEGAPEEVGGSFFCNNNNLTTLKGSPKVVKEYFDCSDNKLKSLEGAPEEAGFFSCSENSVKFTEGDVKKVCKVKYKIHV